MLYVIHKKPFKNHVSPYFFICLSYYFTVIQYFVLSYHIKFQKDVIKFEVRN